MTSQTTCTTSRQIVVVDIFSNVTDTFQWRQCPITWQNENDASDGLQWRGRQSRMLSLLNNLVNLPAEKATWTTSEASTNPLSIVSACAFLSGRSAVSLTSDLTRLTGRSSYRTGRALKYNDHIEWNELIRFRSKSKKNNHRWKIPPKTEFSQRIKNSFEKRILSENQKFLR